MSDAGYPAVTHAGLPIPGGGAHPLGRLSRRVARERTTTFLEPCTKPVGPSNRPLKCATCQVFPNGVISRQSCHIVLVRAGRPLSPPIGFTKPSTCSTPSILSPRTSGAWHLSGSARNQIFESSTPMTTLALPSQHAQQFGGPEYVWSIPLGTSCLGSIHNNNAKLGAVCVSPMPAIDCPNVPILGCRVNFHSKCRPRNGAFGRRRRRGPSTRIGWQRLVRPAQSCVSKLAWPCRSEVPLSGKWAGHRSPLP